MAYGTLTYITPALQQHNFHSVKRTSCSCAAGCVSVVFRVGCTTQALHMYRVCTPMLHACGSCVVLAPVDLPQIISLLSWLAMGNVDRCYALSSRSPSDATVRILCSAMLRQQGDGSSQARGRL